jgi:DNA repair protein RecN (Recombination protein N)
MLQTLRVRNLAIVDSVQVEFRDGLSVITGETGAGKSVLVGALALVLGERADKDLIRAGEDQCAVEATFQLPDSSDVDTILDELGLPPCEDGRLIIRRVVSASGAGKNLVNDAPATLQLLKRIGDRLVDMHGPHDHQSLLDRGFQLDLLDSFGHLWKSRDAYEAHYRKRLELDARRRELETDDDTVAQQLDLLTYQVKEIEQAELAAGCEEDLQREHITVANAQRILELTEAARAALTEADTAAFAGLAAAQKALADLHGILPEAEAWQGEARSAAIQVQELSTSIADRAANIEGDPGRLQWLEDRLALLHKLKKKYGGSVEATLAFLTKAKERLRDL